MAALYSHYYEKEFELSEEGAQTLMEIYAGIAKDKGFEPDAASSEQLFSDPEALDTVLYHVEQFGASSRGYEDIEYLFE